MEYDLDSNPVDRRGRAMYLERFIHGEIFRSRPEVNSVVHTHSPSIVPFAASSVALRPLYHMSGFLAAGVPVFEIREAAGMTDLLIRRYTHNKKSLDDVMRCLYYDVAKRHHG